MYRELQRGEQIIAQSTEVGGQQQFGLTGRGQLVVHAQVGALPTVWQVQHQNRLINLYPLHALVGEAVKDVAVDRDQLIQQRQLGAVVGTGKGIALAQVQVSERAGDHRFRVVALCFGFFNLFEQAFAGDAEGLIGGQFRDAGEVAKALPSSHIGIRCLNDSDNAVAGSLAAVRAGARQVQGSFNGLGMRCGNANLASVIPNLTLKLDFETAVSAEALSRLTAVSRHIDARLNQPPAPRAPFVGAAAFSHGDGTDAAAALEHIDPQAVGNQRRLAAEDQADPENISRRLAALGIAADLDDPMGQRLLEMLRDNEQNGLTYDGAEASFELLARGCFGTLPNFFRLDSFRVIDERRVDARGQLVTLSEASVRVQVGENRHMMVAEGAGPVHALDEALRKSLGDAYPSLSGLRLVDYKVRILNSEGGTKARIRVMIDSSDGIDNWSTVGVSDNVIDASYSALHDGIIYKLLRDELKREAASGGSEAPDGET